MKCKLWIVEIAIVLALAAFFARVAGESRFGEAVNFERGKTVSVRLCDRRVLRLQLGRKGLVLVALQSAKNHHAGSNFSRFVSLES